MTTTFDNRMELLERLSILSTLEDMTTSQRLDFVSAIGTVFCVNCGSDARPNGICTCCMED